MKELQEAIAKSVGLICNASGWTFNEAMADAWMVVLKDDLPLEPFLVEATRECLKTENKPTIYSVRSQAVEYLKRAERAANRNVEPPAALPAPSPESLAVSRTKMQDAWRKVTEKFGVKMEAPE